MQAAKFDEFVLWTCISAPRNIAGFPFPSAMRQDERFEIEDLWQSVFASFPSSLDGEYPWCLRLPTLLSLEAGWVQCGSRKRPDSPESGAAFQCA